MVVQKKPAARVHAGWFYLHEFPEKAKLRIYVSMLTEIKRVVVLGEGDTDID